MRPAFAGRAAECVDADRPPRQNRPVHTTREMTDQEVALLRSKLTPMLERLAAESGLSITMGKITYTRHNAVFAVEAAVRGEGGARWGARPRRSCRTRSSSGSSRATWAATSSTSTGGIVEPASADHHTRCGQLRAIECDDAA